ncbi:MAG: hypothetical protein QF921_10335 [Pseudomonadales bacterium]|mgnify:CR=1 FL=1|nr:hypothetical protein [Pseudomonadales bacterium]MDP6469731.1 hypothetical protein [Pseudomonadales bacterium]MDP6971892.1 hypothetical protein [Pseudomonadales bacterium]|tara:strand:- start:10014 stop:11477 length:1464 start_codon:yes stop_codon:yes gene_type:complete
MPVLVGVGLTTQREPNVINAREPLALMIDAANAAGDDGGNAGLLRDIERILVPVGRWQYRNPGRLIGDAIGASHVESISALPGVSQQTVMSDACNAIASGEISCALVIGGEAGYRLQRAKAEGVRLEATQCEDLADVVMKPHDEMQPDYEVNSGLGYMPVGYYAIIDSAFRHRHGFTTGAYRDLLAERYSAFSKIASQNPHAWDREHVAAEQIRNASRTNPMLAFPYTKLHNSQWNVDQASALLFCSADKARQMGVPRDRWVFPQVFTESNHMLNITARGRLDRCVGAEYAGRAAFEAAAIQPAELDFLELYSCFPVAVESFAAEIGALEHIAWSFTGAMPFAGGPLNNFVLHAVGQLVRHLRNKPHSRGMVTTVSGLLTKQGFGIWGTDPNPNGYQFVDVTDAVAAATDERVVVPNYVGAATVAGYTVLYDREGPQRSVAIVDLPDGKRSIAHTDDVGLMTTMQSEEFCGMTVQIAGGRFSVDKHR